jgi:hypothetical protein
LRIACFSLRLPIFFGSHAFQDARAEPFPNSSQATDSAGARPGKWHNFRIANGFREGWHDIKRIGPQLPFKAMYQPHKF